MGAAEGNYFAAAAAHAAALGGETSTWFSRDSRRLPLLIIAGTQDPVFPKERVQATVDALKAQGFPVTLVPLVGRGHMYEPGAKEINGAAWNFLKQHRLDGQPFYVPYEFERGR